MCMCTRVCVCMRVCTRGHFTASIILITCSIIANTAGGRPGDLVTCDETGRQRVDAWGGAQPLYYLFRIDPLQAL